MSRSPPPHINSNPSFIPPLSFRPRPCRRCDCLVTECLCDQARRLPQPQPSLHPLHALSQEVRQEHQGGQELGRVVQVSGLRHRRQHPRLLQLPPVQCEQQGQLRVAGGARGGRGEAGGGQLRGQMFPVLQLCSRQDQTPQELQPRTSCLFSEDEVLLPQVPASPRPLSPRPEGRDGDGE